MPLAEKSIIAPGEVESRAPLKKSTVAWGLGFFVMLSLAGMLLPKLFGTSKGEALPVADQPVVTGRAQDIEEEFRVRPQPAPIPLPVPLPEPVAATPRSIVEPPPPPSGEFDIDAAGRASKSIAFDDQPKAEVVAPQSLVPGVPSPEELAMARTEPAAAQNPASTQLELMKAMAAAQPGSGSQGKTTDQGWLKEFQTASAKRTDPLRPYTVRNPYTLTQGKVIPAVLGRDLNTDLPGGVTACSTIDVYDSLSSNYLLMPKGSCFVGQYSSSIKDGQDRILFAFTRVVMPNGISFDLPGAGGSDLGGAAGLEGDVNNHFFRMFASSFFVAVLSDRFESNASTPTTSIGAAGGAVTAAGQVLVDTSSSILDRFRTISPTITVDKGTRMNIEVTKDMEFPGPYTGSER